MKEPRSPGALGKPNESYLVLTQELFAFDHSY